MSETPMMTDEDVLTNEAQHAFQRAMMNLGNGVGVTREQKTKALRLALQGVLKLIGDNDMRDFSLVHPIETWLNSNPSR